MAKSPDNGVKLLMWALFLTAFATGLAGSAHCVGMCGGIGSALGLNVSKKRFLLTYHAGRLTSYTCLGVIFGALLPLLGIRAYQPTFAAPLRILTATIIILTGIQIVTKWNFGRLLEKYGLKIWQPLSQFVQSLLPLQNHSDGFILGILWGLLPCGLIYSALGLAFSAANPLLAALVMLVFGLGTLPAMLTMTIFAGTLLKALTAGCNRVILGIIIIFLGLWTAQPFV